MKLAEILAETVEEWPETTYCYTQDSSGILCPWGEVPIFREEGWLFGDIDTSETAFVYLAELASDYRTAIVGKDMWLKEKNKLHEAGNKEWREGVDLPPVGIECEHVVDTPCVWGVVKILAHTEVKGVSVAVYQHGNRISHSSEGSFRKIDTKKQERENYIDRIYGVMCKANRPDNRSDMAEALYDAGLRFAEE